MLGQRERLRQIEIAPSEIGTAQGIASKVSELAVLWSVASQACAGARIHRRNKRIRIQPLKCPGLRDTWNWPVRIPRHAGDSRRELRAATVHNAVSIRRIGRARDRERNPAVPKHRARNL